MKHGTGWLGWTEQQTLDTSMPVIRLAIEGRQEMIRDTLEMVFGKPTETTPAPAAQMAPQTIMSMFRAAGQG